MNPKIKINLAMFLVITIACMILLPMYDIFRCMSEAHTVFGYNIQKYIVNPILIGLIATVSFNFCII